MKRRALFGLLLACALALGCFLLWKPAAPDPYAQYQAEYGHMLGLTPAQRLEDYDFLWSVLEESYPYWGLLEREGLDLDGLCREYREKIRAYDNDVDFYAALTGLMDELGDTGHLLLIGGEGYAGSRTAYQGLPSRTTWDETLNTPVSARQYPILAEFEAATGFSAGQEVGSGSAGGDNVTAFFLSDSIAYLKIDSFGAQHIEADRRAIQAFYRQLGQCDHLILDITGNSGGSDAYWQELLVAPLLDEPLSMEAYLTVSATPQNQPFLEEAFSPDQLRPIEELPDLPNFVDRDRMTHFITDTTTVQPAEERAPFHGSRIWLLVDGDVYSASEKFAYFCKETGFATLVGASTGGDGLGCDPVFCALPNSGLIFRYSMMYGLNPDGSSNEEFGTQPDYPSNGESPLVTVLRILLGE